MRTGLSSSSSPPPQLSEDAAFAVATHWHDRIHSWGTLTKDDEDGPVAFRPAHHSLVGHVEWVTLSLPGFGDLDDEAAQIRAMRASIVAWLAISSCAGFGGRENPRFWNRVFTSLWAGQIDRNVRFVEHRDRPFPCVRLQPRSGEQLRPLCAFFRASVDDRELRRVLRPLEPYLPDRWWWKREIPVELVGFELALVTQSRLQDGWSKWSPYLHRQPRLRIVAARAPSTHRQTLTTAMYDSIANKFRDAAVHVPLCELEKLAPSARSVIFLVQQNPHVSQRLRIETLRPRRAMPGEDPSFAAICSALPHTQMIRALELIGAYDAVQLDNVRVVWLGYALFHPATADNSALMALILGLPHMYTDTVEMLRLMATGNNLLVAMGITTTVSSAYYEAQLKPRTRVHAEGDAAAQVIHSCSIEQTVTLCITSMEDARSDRWVRVVVPGVGLGWVKTGRVINTVSRAPGLCPLRRLELSEREYQEGRMETVAPQLLSVLGSSLTHLKILAKVSTPALQAILKECPKLQALRVHHDGECWSHPSTFSLTPSEPKLRTLELLISGPFQSLRAPQLSNLNCLRVIDEDRAKESFDVHREALIETLTRFPCLWCVHWCNKPCYPPPWWEGCVCSWCQSLNPSGDRCELREASYRLLGVDAFGELGSACLSVYLVERLAFLSIFASTSRNNRLPQLTADVVRLVFTFAFSVTTVPRQLLIKYSNNNP